MLKGVSVLPALLVAPALATSAPGIGFVDGYVAGAASQLHDVLNAQNATGFNIGNITIGTDMSSVNDQSLRYGVANRSDATQYVHMTNVSMPNGFGNIYLDMPVESIDGHGLNSFEIGIIEGMLGEGVVNREGNTVTSVTPHVSDAVSLLGSASGMNILHGQTWILNSLSSAIQSGKIDGGYLYTNGSFVVDGNYGNMAGTLLDTYEASLKNLLNELAPNLDNMTQQQVADKMAIKLGKVALEADGRTNVTDELAKTAGNMIFNDAFGISSSDVAGKWMNGELDTAITTYLTQIKTELADLNGLKLNVDQITMNGGNVTVKNTVNLAADQVAINGGNFTVDTGADLTVAGATLNVAQNATLVNNGKLTLGTTDVTFDNDVTGTGTLIVDSGSTLNVGTNGIAQSTITLDGTMNATAREGNTAQFDATTFGGTGTLNLTFTDEGTYHVFSGTGLSDEQVKNSVYDLSWSGGDVTAALKSSEDIAKDNDLSGNAASAVAGLASSSSDKLNNIGLEIQELLAEDTPEARQQVEEATAALNPQTASVVQSAATSVQTTVTNLAASRMSLPAAGRNGGDFDLNAKGAWAQGLYNKTKMNDQFNGYTRGVAAGVDGTINKDVTVGIGYAFNHSDIASNSRDTDIDSNTLFLYGQYKPAEWFVNAVASYTWSDYSEKGTVSGVEKTADYDVGSFGFAVAGGYDFDCGITPELGLRYIHINGGDYSDSLGISNKLDATNYLTSTIGAKYAFDIATVKNVLLRPELRYAIKYDLVSDESSATVAMPGTSSYTLNGDRLPRFGNEFGIGLTMRYNTMDLSLTYDIEVREDYTSQTGMLKFRYEF
jgi:outer membrane autotransporter protein